MPTLSYLTRLTRPALCWLLVAGCVSTSEGEASPLREEVSALRKAHQEDRKRLEALEVLVDAQQMELRRIRGETLGDASQVPNDSSLPIVHLQPPASRTAPALPTDVRVREPPVEVVTELERSPTHANDVEQTTSGSEDADHLFDAAFEKLKTGELVGAAGMFRDFARRFPHHPAADNALLDEGIAYYGLRRYLEALDVFENLSKRYPAGDAVPEALWRAGRLRGQARRIGASPVGLSGSHEELSR